MTVTALEDQTETKKFTVLFDTAPNLVLYYPEQSTEITKIIERFAKVHEPPDNNILTILRVEKAQNVFIGEINTGFKFYNM